MERNEIIKRIETTLSIPDRKIAAVLELTDEGCTIPFIARYRKEKTGQLDEVLINEILENYKKIEELEHRREYILTYLSDEGSLTDELKKQLQNADSLQLLEDIYLPFKPRKKTRADKAIELGLQPLADYIIQNTPSRSSALEKATDFLSDEVKDTETALYHAVDILIQNVSDHAPTRQMLRSELQQGTVGSTVKRGKKEEGKTYQDYFEFSEPVTRMASHRVMALLRGEREKILNISVAPQIDEEYLNKKIMRSAFEKSNELLLEAATDSYKKHLHPSISKEVLKALQERAEEDSLEIFARNLEKIILAAPFGEHAVIGIDPGIRTGCKAALIDSHGTFVKHTTMYIHANEHDVEKILPWISSHNVKGIAIGDGTFGRETYNIIQKHVKGKNITVALVDEDGASVYSASETAREEFPDLDLTVRGAISIGRRFQDPMAELVKIDPKSLGIGQYQHDITPKLLQQKLSQTIEWAVNRVGVNLATASPHLLAYISGLDKKKAANIVAYRTEHGTIKTRAEIKKIKGIGPKAFEQAAGFLRIRDSKNPLDATGVHPESYKSVDQIARFYNTTIEALIDRPLIIKKTEVSEELLIPELTSIISELQQKGLDPREEYKPLEFSEYITSIDDLQIDMVLNGVVDNVVAFGAFVDIGIKEKGLVHISEIADQFIKDVNSVLAVGDRVKVKILEIDKGRKRISLSIKQI